MARKMKDSGIEWIGEIPEGWEIRKIKNNFMIYAGATPKSEKAEYWDGGIPWITPADFKTTDKYVSYGRKSLTALGYDSCGTTLVPAGSIIFSKRAPVGSVVIAKNTLCTNQGCLACIPNDAVNSTYFYYCMSIFTEQFELVSAGTTFKEIAASTFASFLLPCPPLSQQNEIVNFLDKESSRIDSMLSKTRSSIEEYKKLKQAVITQAVTTLNCPNVKLKYLMDIIVDCPHETPIYTFTGNYLVIRTSDQSLASLRCDEYMYRLDEAEYKKRTRRLTLDKDDIVYGREGSWGLACLVPQSNKYCLGQRVMQFRCNTQLLYPKYAMYTLNSETVYMQGALDTIGSTAPHVNISTICNYLLPVPTLTEQKEITNYLDAKCAEIDKLIAKKEQLVKELESYKKSLIYEVVTGKREV